MIEPEHASHVVDELSAYLDGELDAARRAEIELHLAGCADCATVAGDLRGLHRAASELEDRAPDADLWPGIAGRIAASPRARVIPLPARAPRRVSLSWTQLAAASAALVVLAGGAMWLALSGERGLPGVGAGTVAERPAASGDAVLAGFGGESYDTAVADLEEALEASRDQLDPATVQAIERNLEIIDQAIADTRRALAADPNSIYLSEHLAAQMRRKLDVLRTANTMVANASI